MIADRIRPLWMSVLDECDQMMDTLFKHRESLMAHRRLSIEGFPLYSNCINRIGYNVWNRHIMKVVHIISHSDDWRVNTLLSL